MLELIFRGFLEWVYALLVEMWEFIAGGLLDIMGLDFAYLQTHVPIIPQIQQILLAAGWALLLGNLVFQALKSMAAGLGFEGEDPRLLFSRTFVFAFLLLASPQICRIGLDLTSNIMELLRVPDAADVKLVDESVFGALGAAWIMAIICSVIVMFKVLGLVIEIAERYVILAMLTITAPLAFSMGGSKNTASIFSGWCRMFGSMCLLMVTNLVCFKMLFSVLSTVPTGLDVLPWMVLIFAIVKVAKKSDAIITRIGLNPAITGGPAKSLPGMLAYTIIRTAASQVVKGKASGVSGGSRAASANPPSPGAARSGSFFNRFGGSGMGGGRHGPQSSNGTGGGYTYQNSRQQNASSQSASQQANSQQTSSQQGGTAHSSAQQNNSRQENTAHSGARQSAGGSSAVHSSNRTDMGGGRGRQTRRSSVPPGTRRAPGYVPPSGMGTPSAPGAAGTSTSHTSGNTRPGPAGTAAPKPGASVSRPGPAGRAERTAPHKQPNGARSGPAGTASHTQSNRSAHSTSQTTGGTVHSSSQTSGQTSITMGGTSRTSASKAPPTGSPRPPHPGGPAASRPASKPGDTRSTRRKKPDAGTGKPAAPSPGMGHPGPAEKPERSTRRPADSASRPGRNTAPGAPTERTRSTTARQEHTSSFSRTQTERTSSGPATQERSTSQNRTKTNGTASSPVRQEPRKSSVSAPVKGGAPTIRPGPAGTAPAGKRAASTKRLAEQPPKRAKPGPTPQPQRKGGKRHG